MGGRAGVGNVSTTGTQLLRLNPPEGLVGRQFQFFELALAEVSDLGPQRRFGNGAHPECERDGVPGGAPVEDATNAVPV